MKPGYKQTEVGIIPQEWLEMTVGKLIDEGIIEKPLDGNHGELHPKSSDFVDYGIPFVMANNVQGGCVDLVDCSFIRKTQADSLRKGFSKTGDVLLTHKATIGNTAVVGEMPFPYIMLTPQVTYYRVADLQRLSNLYLRHYFDSWGFQSVLRALAGGGTRAYIGISAQHQLPIIVPPNLSEQCAIAEVLSDVDVLLAGLDQLIAKKRDLKQATMQQLLTGQTRLPGFSGEWEVKRLGDHLTFLNNGVNSRAELTSEGQVKYLHYGDIHGSQSLLVNPNVTPMPYLPPSKASRLDRLSDGDLVFADASEDLDGVGKSVEFHRVGESEVVSGMHTIAVRFDKQILADGFKAYLQFIPVFRQHLRRLAAGTKVYATSMSHIASAEIKLPGVKEQAAIAIALSEMDAEIDALESRRAKTRDIKQAMMQELLTGKTRLI